MTRKRYFGPDRAVARELRRIKKAHAELLEHPDAVAQMTRLAALRCRFAELTAIVEADGGATAENVGLVAEARQVNRACALIERELRSWWASHQQRPSAFVLLDLAREQLLARGQAVAAIQGQTEPVTERQSFTAARLLRDARDDFE